MSSESAGPLVSRRGLLIGSVVSLAGLAVGCSADGKGKQASAPTTTEADFSSRFAKFQPADEPNGDLSKVVWPEFVLAAGPEVKRLYEFQVTHGEIMRYMTCFCGCGQSSGHMSNRDCYVKSVGADGSVVFDDMAPS